MAISKMIAMVNNLRRFTFILITIHKNAVYKIMSYV